MPWACMDGNCLSNCWRSTPVSSSNGRLNTSCALTSNFSNGVCGLAFPPKKLIAPPANVVAPLSSSLLSSMMPCRVNGVLLRSRCFGSSGSLPENVDFLIASERWPITGEPLVEAAYPIASNSSPASLFVMARREASEATNERRASESKRP